MRWARASIALRLRISSTSVVKASAYRASRSTAWTCSRCAAETALEWVQAGKGPVLLELKTYRYRGHSMSDPAKYRSREEVQSVRDKSDPIDHAAKELEGMGVGEAALKDIDKDIRRIIGEAADFAETSPEPEAKELYTDVLVET